MTASTARLACRAATVLLLAASALPSSGQSLVERGEYLARAGDCVSCHTATGGEPFAGGLRIDTPFGYMLTPNITPDAETGIGRWSGGDFYRALHDGVNKRGQDMYPTMPYDFYTRVTRADVDALYAYLRTMKPVRNAVDVNRLDFPFNQRYAMGVWRELYFKEGTYRPDPSKSASWNRGAYLVEGLGHCSDCHSPRNLLGGIEKSKQFSGAVIDGWFALDLTSDIATGLGSWSVDDLATYFKTGVGKDKTTTLGPMAEVIRNSLSYLTDADRTAMAEYLKTLPPDSTLRTGRVGSRPDEGARRAAVRRQLHGLPPVARPRRSERIPAARRQSGRARRRSQQHPEGGRPRHSRARQLHRDARIQRPAHGPAGRRHRELHSHELGQQRSAERNLGDGGQAARGAELAEAGLR